MSSRHAAAEPSHVADQVLTRLQPFEPASNCQGPALPDAGPKHLLGLGEVSPLGDGLLVVLLDDHGGDEPIHGGIVGEDGDHVSAPLDLAMQPLEAGIGPGGGASPFGRLARRGTGGQGIAGAVLSTRGQR